MQKELLGYYIRCRLKSIKQHLHAYRQDKNPEHLHRLRVDIKKTKAVRSFAKYIYNHKYSSRRLLPLFHDAGEIREIKIHIRLLASITRLPTDLLAQFREKENTLEQQFIKKIPGYIRSVKNFGDELSLPAKLPDVKTIQQYFSRQQKKGRKVLHKKNREGMHRYRKIIKKMLYARAALPLKLQNLVELNKASLKQSQQQIGEWHDTYCALNFLSHQPLMKNMPGQIAKLTRKERSTFNALKRRFKTRAIQ